ncbi:uncharacterized protein HMPREF1541_00538 [Cyphellophora europaea CBS 101466]|uniref:Carrier domain-containing protein n=1 Tax=Cyphellophora europaea (strain CBS 101466) TaxID=1220924 RepID=W2SEM0_CYPE1|nr:uncharacterized protein HMPREF1541_00538 [Cyphellophora europaea CBS 101466]ETN46354.1 hypothetical protein HMPREF1541_00538 [Cyphellophora europaea CBS 101466]
MDSSSDEAVDCGGKERLYHNSDDSATTLTEVRNDSPELLKTVDDTGPTSHTFTTSAFLNVAAEDRLSLILLAWALLLYRRALIEEESTLSWRWTNLSEKGSETSLSTITTASECPISDLLEAIRQSQNTVTATERGLGDGVTLSCKAAANTQDCVGLSLDVLINDDAVNISVSDRSDSITTEMAMIQVHAFADILESIATNSNQTAAAAISVKERELSQVWQWGSTVPPLLDRGMHEYFVENAQLHPEKSAIVSWDGALSYGELDVLSTNLAVHLSLKGVGLGAAIPFCFEKSAWTVVAVLAVMKAGATFVLTDPTQPEVRLQTIAEEIGARLILTSIKHAELGARIAPSAEVVAVGPEMLRSLPTKSLSALAPVPGSATMYIIFTSGSTGKPKGVMLSHENYTSGAIPRAAAVGYRSHTRVLDFASYAFDVSIDCMLCTLATGGCICVPSNEQRMNDLSGTIREMGVNMVHTTPSVARVLDADIIPSLEVLGLGGEALSARDADRWNQQTHVINAYGPSECTVGCAINNNIAPGRSYVSLGRGVGAILWIVDPENHNELVPIGAEGELVVEGPIVGLGYINEPEKTASVYIEAPSWLRRGTQVHAGRSSRLYKTGDLVKYDPDGSGCVVFVGRKDQQVKVRGQRVELGEVEHHLRSKLPPKTAVAAEVIKPGGGGGDPTLVAFIAEHDASEQSTQEQPAQFSPDMKNLLGGMDATLAADAPVYMIPSAYIPLNEMPIMVSGKTDRKQLRALGSAMSRQQLTKWRVSSRNRRYPETETQKRLAQLWRTLLHDEEDPSLDDNFFTLGGDSIKAMKLVTAARAAGLSLTVASVFANPTLAEMASQIGQAVSVVEEIAPFALLGSAWTAQEACKECAQLCNISEDAIEDILPCTPLQEILMAVSAKVTEAYVAQRVLKLDSLAAAAKFRAAMEKTVAECPIFRTRIVHLPNHGLVQVVSSDQVQINDDQNLKEYVQRDQLQAMELGSPLARFAFVNDMESGSTYFVLTMHHALYDGWSMPLIVDRMNRAYRGLDTHRTAGFPAYIKYLQSMDRESSERYWREHLRGASNQQFPTRASPGYQPKPDSLRETYVQLGDATGCTSTTVATAIRAAWALVSSEYAATDDVVFGETLTGRNAPIPGVEEIEGPMITTVPVRVKIDRRLGAAEFLQDVHRQAVERIPYEHFGLQNIRKTSSDGRKVYSNMFTGLVLHPYVEAAEDAVSAEEPAKGLVPVGDAEAAREALKFNSYAVMLVCTLDPKGFLIMASFDSSILPGTEMDDALLRLKTLVQQFCQKTEAGLSELSTPVMNEVLSASRPAQQDRSNDIAAPPSGNTDNHRIRQLSSVWSRLLEIDQADIEPSDSFFDLGGDSIAAMKLVSEMRQAGFALSVADIFNTRRLTQMASILKDTTAPKQTSTSISPFALLETDDPNQFVEESIRPHLSMKDKEIEDVLPTRPLQEVAVEGTICLPRFSARYELFYFDGAVDKRRLFDCCQRLVDQTEILRTIFVKANERCWGVVVKDINITVTEYDVGGDVDAFAKQLCNLDVETKMPLGSPFCKFMFVQGEGDRSCLIFRISHAQYDEICLPIMLRQLSQMYEGKPVEDGKPFSSFVRHVVRENIPQGIPYWKKLLRESELTRLAPAQPLLSRRPVAFHKAVDISKRPKDFTLATFPTAAWALCLAKRLGLKDVTFGEVASGRNTGLDTADRIIGPCWQYIPFRVKFEPGWVAPDLLHAVQQQHIASGQFEGIGLPEIVKKCTDWPKTTDWFDSVVHQDVAHVEQLSFASGSSRMETVYPHLEPLREWKVQAFNHGNEMVLEIVTRESWEEYGKSLLDGLVTAFEQLVGCSPDQQLLD